MLNIFMPYFKDQSNQKNSTKISHLSSSRLLSEDIYLIDSTPFYDFPNPLSLPGQVRRGWVNRRGYRHTTGCGSLASSTWVPHHRPPPPRAGGPLNFVNSVLGKSFLMPQSGYGFFTNDAALEKGAFLWK